MKIQAIEDRYIRVDMKDNICGLKYSDHMMKTNIENAVLAIKRHVDEVSGAIEIIKYKDICSYCGYDWEEDKAPETLGMPLCCSKAQDEWSEEPDGETRDNR